MSTGLESCHAKDNLQKASKGGRQRRCRQLELSTTGQEHEAQAAAEMYLTHLELRFCSCICHLQFKSQHSAMQISIQNRREISVTETHRAS